MYLGIKDSFFNIFKKRSSFFSFSISVYSKSSKPNFAFFKITSCFLYFASNTDPDAFELIPFVGIYFLKIYLALL